MKESPILFSGSMVNAILNGAKTQTRRVMRDQVCDPAIVQISSPGYCEIINEHGVHIPGFYCPYGQPGDMLWVRESFAAFGRWETRFSKKKGRDEWHFVDMTAECGFSYLFDLPPISGTRDSKIPTWHNRPSIFMPRAASRIMLEITDVRVERLQDISEQDAIAEGIYCLENGEFLPQREGYSGGCLTAESAYAALWESINGPGSWDANPWVWAIEFKRI